MPCYLPCLAFDAACFLWSFRLSLIIINVFSVVNRSAEKCKAVFINLFTYSSELQNNCRISWQERYFARSTYIVNAAALFSDLRIDLYIQNYYSFSFTRLARLLVATSFLFSFWSAVIFQYFLLSVHMSFIDCFLLDTDYLFIL